MRWHYSKAMPAGKLVRIGAWWDGDFKGVVIFSLAARNAHLMFGLEKTQLCELTRVALAPHHGPCDNCSGHGEEPIMGAPTCRACDGTGKQATFHVTQVVSQALKMLKRRCPRLRVVVSFADPQQNHVGGIYQAGNWIYTGTSAPAKMLVLNGKRIHRRNYTGATFDKPRQAIPDGAQWVPTLPKHRYAMPLDKAMRRRIMKKHSKPYPAGALAEGVEHQLDQAVQTRPPASTERTAP